MGAGALRRYHKPVEEESVAEVEAGATLTTEAAQAAALANAQRIAAEQQEQADAANEHPNAPAAEDAPAPVDADDEAESVAPIIQEAGGEESGDDTPEVPVTDVPAGNPGDVSVVTADDLDVAEPVDLSPDHVIPEGLTRGSSTAEWQDFDRSQGGDGTGKRDELAARYLGEK